MNDHELIVAPKMYKRLVALLVDFIVCIHFFAFFQILINPIIEKIFDYHEVLVAYQDKLVEHGIGYYEFDENNNKVYVTYEIGEEEGMISQEYYDASKENFENDDVAMEASNKLNTLSIAGTSIELLFAIIPNYLIFPLIFKNGQTLGKKLMKIAVVTKNGYRIKFVNLLMRNIVGLYLFDLVVSYLFMFSFNIPIIVLVSFIGAICTKGKRTVHDLIANTYIADEEMTVILVE